MPVQWRDCSCERLFGPVGFKGGGTLPNSCSKCLQSWETRNPGWDFRCLDADMIGRYVDLNAHVDLKKQRITSGAFRHSSPLIAQRIWGRLGRCENVLQRPARRLVATGGSHRVLCLRAARRGPGTRKLVSCRATRKRAAGQNGQHVRSLIGEDAKKAPDYFWVHHQFGELSAIDRDALRAWQNTPRISADGPHAIQQVGMYENYDDAKAKIDWTVSVFKLTYRLELDQLGPNSLVNRLLSLTGEAERLPPQNPPESAPLTPAIGLLQVGTEKATTFKFLLSRRCCTARALNHNSWSTAMMASHIPPMTS